jgi:hypothetical protein
MKQFFIFYLAGTLLLGIGGAGCTSDESPDTPPQEFTGEILYSFAPDAPATDDYTVSLNGTPYYIYPSEVADIVTFGIKGLVSVAITSKNPVSRVKIRPESAGITPTVNGNTIVFTLSKPQFLSIEINGTPERPLLIFADAPETEVPDKDDPSVLYFAAGEIHNIYPRKDITADKKTVYIAPGAIVHGGLRADGKDNIRIMGRGILTGERHTTRNYRMVELDLLKNATVEGITIVDSKTWTVALTVAENITIQGVKIVNKAATDDGIDIVGSRNVTIDNCFIHTVDDCVAIKAGLNYYVWSDTGKDVVGVTVKNSIFWNVNPGSNVFEIGYELGADMVKDVLYENNDIIHLPGQLYSEKGAFAIHNSGRAIVDNIVYKNIRIEDASVYLMDFHVLYDPTYSKDPVHGKILNVYVEDISVKATGTMRSIMRSLSAASNIEHVWIKNLRINGQKITREEDLFLNTNDFMPTITIE